MNEGILQRIRAYVRELFRTSTPSYLTYHNLEHTENVVAHAMEIGNHYKIEPQNEFILVAAAWFHDTGNLYTVPENHEEKSVEVMDAFLNNLCETPVIREIRNVIMATRYPTQPGSFLEEMICDADTYHFGTPQFFVTDRLVRTEIETRTGIRFQDWNKHALNLLKCHRFYTSYCQNLLDKGKHENIRILGEIIHSAPK